jgi:hypothetical protein
MGCSYKSVEGTKCCFDCEYTHCPYMCSGLPFKKSNKIKMHKECNYYTDKDYRCVEEEKAKIK